jgi:phage shock protein PspC (stress-responsive transcriptional regulator)
MGDAWQAWNDHLVSAAASPLPKLTRSRSDRLVAGVAGGIAVHTRLSPVLVRIIFVLLLPVSGLGALLYAAFWAVLPFEPVGDPGQESARRWEPWRLLPWLAGAVAVMLANVLVLDNTDVALAGGWLVALIAVGAGIIWHQADPSQRERWSARATGRSWAAAC